MTPRDGGRARATRPQGPLTSWIYAVFQTEEERRDASSAVMAVGLFYGFLLLFAAFNEGRMPGMPGPVSAIKIKLQESVPQTALEDMNKPTTPAKPIQPAQRESVMAQVHPSPATPEVERKEFQPAQDHPRMWEDERKDMAEKSSADAAPVDLPEPSEAAPEMVNQKPEPIRQEIADVKQTRALSEKSAQFPNQAPEPQHAEPYMPAPVSAPNEVVRRSVSADFKPQAEGTPQAPSMSPLKRLLRAISKRAGPTPEVQVTDAHLAPDIPQSPAVNPGNWEGARTGSVAEEYKVDAGSVAMPADVADQSVRGGEALGGRVKPMEASVSAVNPTANLRRAEVAGLAGPALPVSSGKSALPMPAAAPNDVVRRSGSSDFKPEAEGTPEAASMTSLKRMQRGVAKKGGPTADVQVTDARLAPDLPQVQAASPGRWEGARTEAAAGEYKVQAAGVALPAVAADQGVKGGDALGGRVKPMEASVSAVNPTANLRRVEVAAMAGPAKPVSAGKTNVSPAAAPAPVDVRRKSDAKAVAFEPTRQVQVDGLQVSDEPSMKNSRGRGSSSGGPARASTSKEVMAAPAASLDLPAAPEASPDKWSDAARLDRPALAEKTSISAGGVSMSTRVTDLVETFTISTAHHDVDIENVVSEFEVLTLSERAPPSGAPSASAPSAGGDGSSRRGIISSTKLEIPKWYEEKGISSVGTFRVHITSDGDVKAVDIEKTTGFKDIDANCISMIMNSKYEKGDSATTVLLKIRIKLRE